MFGLGGKQTRDDQTKLTIFVHTVQSAEAFQLAQKVWETNSRNSILDATNQKQLLRFAFSHPACVVWLERDQGRTDAFELILIWGNDAKKEVTEVYTITAASRLSGDDSRAKELLHAMLAAPAIVPVELTSSPNGKTNK